MSGPCARRPLVRVFPIRTCDFTPCRIRRRERRGASSARDRWSARPNLSRAKEPRHGPRRRSLHGARAFFVSASAGTPVGPGRCLTSSERNYRALASQAGPTGGRLPAPALEFGGMSRVAKGVDCKSAGLAFAGSSPASPTKRAVMAEPVDAPGSNPGAERHPGSTPGDRTKSMRRRHSRTMPALHPPGAAHAGGGPRPERTSRTWRNR